MKLAGADSTRDATQSSRLIELADGLMDRAATLAAQSDQLIAALDDVARRLVESGQGIASPSIPTPIRLLQPLTASDRNGHQAPPISDGARLMIAQMAVGGSSHEEIATRLAGELGVKNADEILELLGH